MRITGCFFPSRNNPENGYNVNIRLGVEFAFPVDPKTLQEQWNLKGGR